MFVPGHFLARGPRLVFRPAVRQVLPAGQFTGTPLCRRTPADVRQDTAIIRIDRRDQGKPPVHGQALRSLRCLRSSVTVNPPCTLFHGFPKNHSSVLRRPRPRHPGYYTSARPSRSHSPLIGNRRHKKTKPPPGKEGGCHILFDFNERSKLTSLPIAPYETRTFFYELTAIHI